MTEVTFALRRLAKLNDKVGGGKKNNEPEVDTSKMSAYEQQQYKIACDMKRVREDILELDNLGDKASITRKTELSNSIRKGLNTMKQETSSLMKLAVKDKKKDEYDQLVSHVKKTDQLYRARFGGRQIDDASSPTGGPNTVNSLEMQDLGSPMVSLRDDEEFVQFFQQTQKNDITIDQAIDRIAQGVTRLHENAVAIKSELAVQNTLLDETETKLDKVHGNLKGVNKKLKETIKQVDKDRLCLYLFCCIILLGLAGGVYFVVIKKQ